MVNSGLRFLPEKRVVLPLSGLGQYRDAALRENRQGGAVIKNLKRMVYFSRDLSHTYLRSKLILVLGSSCVNRQFDG